MADATVTSGGPPPPPTSGFDISSVPSINIPLSTLSIGSITTPIRKSYTGEGSSFSIPGACLPFSYMQMPSSSIPVGSRAGMPPFSTFMQTTTVQASNRLLGPSTPFGGNLTQNCTVKLDTSNYLLWRSTILPIIRGYRLEGHLLGTETCHPQVTGSGFGSSLNPAYKDWIALDSLLMGWLMASMTEAALQEVVGCTSAFELWHTLEVLLTTSLRLECLNTRVH